MSSFVLRSARFIAEACMNGIIQPGDTVIDATVGNGHDTNTLAGLVGIEGHVFGFDIQQQAIDSAKQRLTESGLIDRCTLFCVGHEHMAQFVHVPVKAVFFNLGWLPGGNKNITTLWETTYAAIQQSLDLIIPNGIVSICAYPGHEEGNIEKTNIIRFLSTLRPQQFNVLEHRFLNAGSNAPECFLIQKQSKA